MARRTNTSGSRPEAIIVCAYVLAATFAAKTLVNMPPLPNILPAPPAISSNSACPAWASEINVASGFFRGSAEYKPS